MVIDYSLRVVPSKFPNLSAESLFQIQPKDGFKVGGLGEHVVES